jgi:hypothetical protein
MSDVLTEGNLCFDFSACGDAMRFDDDAIKMHGLKAVDFFIETEDMLYFIEVKDYQNPKSQRRNEDMAKLKEAMKAKNHGFFLEMGDKIKDSILRCYAESYTYGNPHCQSKRYPLAIKQYDF